MQITTPADKPVNKKLQQFLDEIKELEEKYQYRMIPSLNFSLDGVKPYLRVVEVLPKKGKEKKILRVRKNKKHGK